MKRSLIQCSGREMHSGSTALLDVKNQRIIKTLLDIIMQLSAGLKKGFEGRAKLKLPPSQPPVTLGYPNGEHEPEKRTLTNLASYPEP